MFDEDSGVILMPLPVRSWTTGLAEPLTSLGVVPYKVDGAPTSMLF